MERTAGSIATRAAQTLAALAVVGFLVFAATPAPADTPIWSFDSVSSSGDVVNVGIRNNGFAPLTGRIAVQAVVGDSPIWSTVDVSVPANGSVLARVPFPGSVRSVQSIGFVPDAGSR